VKLKSTTLAVGDLICSQAIASIFVNPTQFGPNEDFDRYPRMVDSDVQKLQTVHTDYVFVPSTQDMYPGDPPQAVFVTVDGVEKVAEGGSRPGFFRGVATVVSKLFNIVQPTKAYFGECPLYSYVYHPLEERVQSADLDRYSSRTGQKDGMQCIVLRRMVRELNFPVELVICPTVRESDGLAMSSRNAYLSPAERAVAPVIYRGLQAAERLYKHQGQHAPAALRSAVMQVLKTEPSIEPLYVSVGEMSTGAELGDDADGAARSKKGVMLSVAVKLGKTRLIDNILLEP